MQCNEGRRCYGRSYPKKDPFFRVYGIKVCVFYEDSTIELDIWKSVVHTNLPKGTMLHIRWNGKTHIATEDEEEHCLSCNNIFDENGVQSNDSTLL